MASFSMASQSVSPAVTAPATPAPPTEAETTSTALLAAIVGTWELDHARSDDPGPLLERLGVPWLFRVLAPKVVQQEIILEPGRVRIRVSARTSETSPAPHRGSRACQGASRSMTRTVSACGAFGASSRKRWYDLARSLRRRADAQMPRRRYSSASRGAP